MNPNEREEGTKREGTPGGGGEEKRSERPIAPPIEREHETAAGVFEEDERRERERR
jgi:hypothetical protein